jgi:hypothetical protein
MLANLDTMKCHPVIITLFVLCFFAGCDLDQEIMARYELRDGHWVYVHWNEGSGTVRDPVIGADSSSFKELSEPEYAVDKNVVYFRGSIIVDAIPASFRRIQGNYWRDSLHVFFVNDEIPGADPQSFSPLPTQPWSRDKNCCYRANTRIASSDPETFTVINFYWAKDARHYYAYRFGRDISPVNCDYASMQILNPGSKLATYAKDKDHAYWLGKEIAGADVATFQTINDVMAKDKFRRYSGSGEFWMDKRAREANSPTP